MTTAAALPLLPTSIVGSCALPGWFLVTLDAARRGELGDADLREAIDDATALALRDQERAGIDLVSEGEVRRHDFIMGFYQRLSGLRELAPSRRLGPPLYDTMPLYQPVERVTAPDGLGLLQELETARRFTARPLKVAVPGPLTLLNAIKLGGPYRDHDTLAADLVAIVNAELRALEAAGCRYLQIDEPSAPYHFHAPRRVVEAVNETARGVGEGPGTTLALHVCFGNLRGRPQDRRSYRDWLPVLGECRARVFLLEFANRELAELEAWAEFGSATGGKTLAAGLIDVKSFYVEKPEEVAARVRRALSVVAPERLWVVPDCGFFATPRWIAAAKMTAMVRGVEIVRRELAG